MGILSDREILRQIELGNIVIKPFKRESLGTNSYDVHLGPYLRVYVDSILDAKKDNRSRLIKIPPEGYVLQPNRLYLGTTLEYTETYGFVPSIEGRSSVGRLGIQIHVTAGFGDVGFKNYWTLEITAIHPVRIYAGMPIAQLIYTTLEGEPEKTYDKKKSAKYLGSIEEEPIPLPSKLWKDEW